VNLQLEINLFQDAILEENEPVKLEFYRTVLVSDPCFRFSDDILACDSISAPEFSWEEDSSNDQ
jgi:hypothetical protein